MLVSSEKIPLILYASSFPAGRLLVSGGTTIPAAPMQTPAVLPSDAPTQTPAVTPSPQVTQTEQAVATEAARHPAGCCGIQFGRYDDHPVDVCRG